MGQRQGIIEREIENELVANIAKTILELGTGFAFMGNQYHLTVGNDDFYIDLLFYNTKLYCHFVIELKAGKFKPEYAGKVNFYLSAVDDMLKHERDNPSIGIILYMRVIPALNSAKNLSKDNYASVKTDNRPAFQQMIADSKKKLKSVTL